MMTRYCGRDFTPKEFEQIRSLIKQNPEFNRKRLSKEVCRTLQWLKPDGKLKDMSCRVAMLRMHKDGLIALPPPTHAKTLLHHLRSKHAHAFLFLLGKRKRIDTLFHEIWLDSCHSLIRHYNVKLSGWATITEKLC